MPLRSALQLALLSTGLLIGSSTRAAAAAVGDVDCSAGPPASPLGVATAWQRFDACNRDMIAARRAVVTAGAEVRIAGQRPNPTIAAAAGGYNPQLGIGSGGPASKTIDSSLRLEQLIERGGKAALRTTTAERLQEAAALDVADVRRQQGTTMLTALVDVAAGLQRLAVLSEIEALNAEASRANEQRFARGDVARIDVQRQAIEALRAQADLRQAQAEMQRSRLALGALLGWSGEGPLDVDASVLAMSDDAADLSAAPERADVRAARRRVEALAAARDLARAQSRADVTIGLQYDHYPPSAANTNGTGNTYSISASIPLLIRHRYEGEVAKATSEYYAAQETVARTMAAADNDWARLTEDIRAGEARLRVLERDLAPQAEQVARSAETGYAKGALGVLDVLDARRVARQTRLDLIAARADVARARAARNAWLLAERPWP